MRATTFLIYQADTGEIQGRYTSPASIEEAAVYHDPGQAVLALPSGHPALSEPEAWVVRNTKVEQR